MSQYRVCGGRQFTSTDTWDVHSSTISGTMDAYTGTQESVNTFFAKLELQTDYASRTAWRRRWACLSTTRAGRWCRRSPSASPRSARSSSPTPMRPSRPAVCTPRPTAGHLDRRLQRPRAQDLPRAVPAGDRCARGRCRQRRAPRRPVADRLRRCSAAQPGVRAKTGTNDNNMSVWYMGYTPNLATASMIAGANRLGHWVTLNGQLLAGTYVPTAHGSTHRWADVVRRDAGHPELPAGRDVHPAERQRHQRRAHHRPRRGRTALRPGGPATPAGRLHRRRRRCTATPATRRTRWRTPTRPAAHRSPVAPR